MLLLIQLNFSKFFGIVQDEYVGRHFKNSNGVL